MSDENNKQRPNENPAESKEAIPLGEHLQYKTLQVQLNSNSVDGQHSQQLSSKWKIISSAGNEEVPQRSRQQSLGNTKDVVAHYFDQKFVGFFCLFSTSAGLWFKTDSTSNSHI